MTWPFDEPTGAWEGEHIFRWRSAGITVEQAISLTNRAGWKWSVCEDYATGEFVFTLTRRTGPEPAEVVPRRRRNRWSTK